MTYGFLFLGQKFPATERVQSGVSFACMFTETFFRPLFLVLVVCMMMTASVELGPNRWVPAVLQSAGIPGILVLVWINLLMAVMRYFAGPVVRRLAPTGILLGSAVLSGLGLFWLSHAETLAMAIAGTSPAADTRRDVDHVDSPPLQFSGEPHGVREAQARVQKVLTRHPDGQKELGMPGPHPVDDLEEEPRVPLDRSAVGV